MRDFIHGLRGIHVAMSKLDTVDKALLLDTDSFPFRWLSYEHIRLDLSLLFASR